MKRSLGEKTKTFIANNVRELEEYLAPTLRGFAEEIHSLEGPRGRVIEISFREARTAWEKFFWVSLGRHWITLDLSLERAVRRAEDDLMSLSNVLETVVVLAKLAESDRSPSITCPISIQVEDAEILEERSEEMDDLITLEPTVEVDLAHPRVVAGAVPRGHIRAVGPEETTVVEGIRGRPKL